MPFCSTCGGENPEGAKFCAKCGAALAAPAPAQPQPAAPAPAPAAPAPVKPRPAAPAPAAPAPVKPRPAAPAPTATPAKQALKAPVVKPAQGSAKEPIPGAPNQTQFFMAAAGVSTGAKMKKLLIFIVCAVVIGTAIFFLIQFAMNQQEEKAKATAGTSAKKTDSDAKASDEKPADPATPASTEPGSAKLVEDEPKDAAVDTKATAEGSAKAADKAVEVKKPAAKKKKKKKK